MKKTEILSTIGGVIGLSAHFLLNMNLISLLSFCVLSMIPPIAFAVNGYLNKDRAFLIQQAGWFFIAVVGVVKNF
jgi:hypothetical protein